MKRNDSTGFQLPPYVAPPIVFEARLLTQQQRSVRWAYFAKPAWTRRLSASRNRSLAKRLEALA